MAADASASATSASEAATEASCLGLELGRSSLRVGAHLLPPGPGAIGGGARVLLGLVELALGVLLNLRDVLVELLVGLGGRCAHGGLHLRHAFFEFVKRFLEIHVVTPVIVCGLEFKRVRGPGG